MSQKLNEGRDNMEDLEDHKDRVFNREQKSAERTNINI